MSEKRNLVSVWGTPSRWLKNLGNIVGALWIAGGAFFFITRVSAIVYQTNQSAIDKIIARLLHS